MLSGRRTAGCDSELWARGSLYPGTLSAHLVRERVRLYEKLTDYLGISVGHTTRLCPSLSPWAETENLRGQLLLCSASLEDWAHSSLGSSTWTQETPEVRCKLWAHSTFLERASVLASFLKGLRLKNPSRSKRECSSAPWAPLPHRHCGRGRHCLYGCLGLLWAVLRDTFKTTKEFQAHFFLSAFHFCPQNDPARSPSLVTSFGSK